MSNKLRQNSPNLYNWIDGVFNKLMRGGDVEVLNTLVADVNTKIKDDGIESITDKYINDIVKEKVTDTWINNVILEQEPVSGQKLVEFVKTKSNIREDLIDSKTTNPIIRELYKQKLRILKSKPSKNREEYSLLSKQAFVLELATTLVNGIDGIAENGNKMRLNGYQEIGRLQKQQEKQIAQQEEAKKALPARQVIAPQVVAPQVVAPQVVAPQVVAPQVVSQQDPLYGKVTTLEDNAKQVDNTLQGLTSRVVNLEEMDKEESKHDDIPVLKNELEVLKGKISTLSATPTYITELKTQIVELKTNITELQSKISEVDLTPIRGDITRIDNQLANLNYATQADLNTVKTDLTNQTKNVKEELLKIITELQEKNNAMSGQVSQQAPLDWNQIEPQVNTVIDAKLVSLQQLSKDNQKLVGRVDAIEQAVRESAQTIDNKFNSLRAKMENAEQKEPIQQALQVDTPSVGNISNLQADIDAIKLQLQTPPTVSSLTRDLNLLKDSLKTQEASIGNIGNIQPILNKLTEDVANINSQIQSLQFLKEDAIEQKNDNEKQQVDTATQGLFDRLTKVQQELKEQLINLENAVSKNTNMVKLKNQPITEQSQALSAGISEADLKPIIGKLNELELNYQNSQKVIPELTTEIANLQALVNKNEAEKGNFSNINQNLENLNKRLAKIDADIVNLQNIPLATEKEAARTSELQVATQPDDKLRGIVTELRAEVEQIKTQLPKQTSVTQLVSPDPLIGVTKQLADNSQQIQEVKSRLATQEAKMQQLETKPQVGQLVAPQALNPEQAQLGNQLAKLQQDFNEFKTTQGPKDAEQDKAIAKALAQDDELRALIEDVKKLVEAKPAVNPVPVKKIEPAEDLSQKVRGLTAALKVLDGKITELPIKNIISRLNGIDSNLASLKQINATPKEKTSVVNDLKPEFEAEKKKVGKLLKLLETKINEIPVIPVEDINRRLIQLENKVRVLEANPDQAAVAEVVSSPVLVPALAPTPADPRIAGMLENIKKLNEDINALKKAPIVTEVSGGPSVGPGTQGDRGPVGPRGPTGPAGIGNRGSTGPEGPPGAIPDASPVAPVVAQQEVQGIYGVGQRGPTGADGQKGATGKDGNPGKDGNSGKDGNPGKDGNQGPPGTIPDASPTTPSVVQQVAQQGVPGVGQRGADGQRGPTGADGQRGPTGEDGQRGSTGPPADLANLPIIQQLQQELVDVKRELAKLAASPTQVPIQPQSQVLGAVPINDQTIQNLQDQITKNTVGLNDIQKAPPVQQQQQQQQPLLQPQQPQQPPDYTKIKNEIYNQVLQEMSKNKTADTNRINNGLMQLDKIMKNADSRYITKKDIDSISRKFDSLEGLRKSVRVLLQDAIRNKGGIPDTKKRCMKNVPIYDCPNH